MKPAFEVPQWANYLVRMDCGNWYFCDYLPSASIKALDANTNEVIAERSRNIKTIKLEDCL